MRSNKEMITFPRKKTSKAPTVGAYCLPAYIKVKDQVPKGKLLRGFVLA